MAVFSQQRMVQEIREQVALVSDHTPNYRNGLVKALIEILRAQDQGLSDRSRRERVKRIIENLGVNVLDETDDEA